MELVNKTGRVLADEEQLRKGFCYKGVCFLKTKLPSCSKDNHHHQERFFFFDNDNNLIESSSDDELFLQPDKEVFLFRCQIFLSDKKVITEVDFSYRRISFEVDDETSTYFVVGSRDFIKTSKEIEKKIKKEIHALV